MTVHQAARELGISLTLCYQLVAARKIPHERHGLGRGRIVITDADLAEYRQRCRVEAADQQQAVEPRRRVVVRDRIGELMR